MEKLIRKKNFQKRHHKLDVRKEVLLSLAKELSSSSKEEIKEIIISYETEIKYLNKLLASYKFGKGELKSGS